MGAPELNSAFTDNADKFEAYANTVRGYVRYEVVHRNLEELVQTDPLNVIDIGGGSGIDTLWLAEQGHTVTLLEPATEQLTKARKRLAEARPEVRDRVSFIQATPEEVEGLDGSFDLVLSHGVAMYAEKPQGFIDAIAKLAKVGGYVSLLEKGYYGKEAHLITEQKWVQLSQLRQRHKVINNTDRLAAAFLPQELKDMLKRAGANPVRWSGVRVVTDTMDMPVTDLTPDQLKAVIDVEYEQGRHEQIRGQGQMLHFIARKIAQSSKKPPLWWAHKPA